MFIMKRNILVFWSLITESAMFYSHSVMSRFAAFSFAALSDLTIDRPLSIDDMNASVMWI